METMPLQQNPRELHVASYLLWAAFCIGIVSAAIDFAGIPTPNSGRIAGLAIGIAGLIGIATILLTAAAIYFFSLGRNWARIACLILFLIGLAGAVLQVRGRFDRSAIAGWLFLTPLLMQAVAMYLAFTAPASKCFHHTPADDVAMRMILPVGRSGWAIAAGYLALFSVLLLPAPLALASGIMGIRDIRRHPEKHGMGRAVFGVVMGSLRVIGLVVVSSGGKLVQ